MPFKDADEEAGGLTTERSDRTTEREKPGREFSARSSASAATSAGNTSRSSLPSAVPQRRPDAPPDQMRNYRLNSVGASGRGEQRELAAEEA